MSHKINYWISDEGFEEVLYNARANQGKFGSTLLIRYNRICALWEPEPTGHNWLSILVTKTARDIQYGLFFGTRGHTPWVFRPARDLEELKSLYTGFLKDFNEP